MTRTNLPAPFVYSQWKNYFFFFALALAFGFALAFAFFFAAMFTFSQMCGLVRPRQGIDDPILRVNFTSDSVLHKTDSRFRKMLSL
jgi:hypothetical protein